MADLGRLANLWGASRLQREYQGWTVAGMNPIENVRNANIPILLYHGDYDTAADIWHSERFAAALRSNNKPHEYVVIPEMPHGAVNPEMRRREFQLVEDFIRGTCGISY